jgi:hypothetical protein
VANRNAMKVQTLLLQNLSRNLWQIRMKNFFTILISQLLYGKFKHLQYLQLCLPGHEANSMKNILIRHSSPGLFAGGVNEIRRVYCSGLLLITQSD